MDDELQFGAVSASQFRKLLHQSHKQPFARRGWSTGWDSLDELTLINPGHLMTITATPGTGKSEFVDGLMVNMAVLNDKWRVAMFSPENYPIHMHVQKLAEKYIGKQINKMTGNQVDEALAWIDDHFVWLNPAKTTLDGILELIADVDDITKLTAFIIDPFNELDPSDKAGRRDDEYIADCLRKINIFARARKLVPIIVTHPVKQIKDDQGNYKPVTAYDIAGGAMWYNKSSYIYSLHRQNRLVNELTVYVQKVKYKTMGKCGYVVLDYDYQSGRLKDKGAMSFTLPETEAPF